MIDPDSEQMDDRYRGAGKRHRSNALGHNCSGSDRQVVPVTNRTSGGALNRNCCRIRPDYGTSWHRIRGTKVVAVHVGKSVMWRGLYKSAYLDATR